jgi:nucleoside-triphosphatase
VGKTSVLKNLDLYIALAVAAILILYDFWEEVTDSTYRQVIVLQLIVISLLLLRNAGYLRNFIMEFHKERKEQSVADIFFTNNLEESDLLDGEIIELKILQETGSLFLEKNKERIIALSNRGVKIHFLVSVGDPCRAAVLAFRNENLPEASALKNRSTQFLQQFNYVSKNTNEPKNIKLRFTFYDPGYTLCLSKSSMRKTGIVRLAGFRVPYPRKLDFMIDQKSPTTFLQYESEFDSLFSSSSKILLLTGEPRTGKTSLIKKLFVGNDPRIFTCFSEEIIEGGSRAAFSLSWNGNTKEFSRKNPQNTRKKSSPDDYTVDQDLISQLSEDMLAHKGPVFVIDEIGPLQLTSEKFVNALNSLIARPEAWIIATIAKDDSHPFIKILKNNPRSELVELTSQNLISAQERFSKEIGEIRRVLSIY